MTWAQIVVVLLYGMAVCALGYWWGRLEGRKIERLRDEAQQDLARLLLTSPDRRTRRRAHRQLWSQLPEALASEDEIDTGYDHYRESEE